MPNFNKTMKKIQFILWTFAIALAGVNSKAQGTWSARAPMLTPVNQTGCCVFNNQLYVFGGDNNANEVVDAAQAYDPISDTWTSLAPLPLALNEVGVVAVGGKILVIGGGTTTVFAY